MSETAQIVQLSIFIIIVFILDREQNRISHNMEILDKQHQEIEHVCHLITYDIMILHIKCALTDLQLGNVTYTTVFQMIRDSNLPEDQVKIFFSLLDEVAEAYNISKA